MPSIIRIFSKNTLPQAIAAAREDMGEANKAVALNFYKRVTDKPPTGTPVLSGFHAGAWNFTADRRSRRLPSKALKRIGRRERRRTIPRPTPRDANVATKPDTKFFVANFAPAIRLLNEPGISQQSPAGWVDRARAATQRSANRIVGQAFRRRG